MKEFKIIPESAMSEEEYALFQLGFDHGRLSIDKYIVTSTQDAFCRLMAKKPEGKEGRDRDISLMYRKLYPNGNAPLKIKTVLKMEKIQERIAAYRKVFMTDKDALLAAREVVTKKIEDAWTNRETVSTGETTQTMVVKTSDLLTAYKDRETLYLANEKKEEERGVTINITGDAKAMVERAKAARNIQEAEIKSVEKTNEKE